MKKLSLLLSLSIIICNLEAQITVSNVAPYNTPAFLVNNVLLGSGVIASNVNFAGQGAQLGFFNGGLNGAPALGLDSGIVISSGDVNDIPPGGFQPDQGQYAGLGDPDLLAIAQSVTSNPSAASITSTNDAAFLEFDFTPVGDSVKFRFVFASEEYPGIAGGGFINQVFNDVFAFFVSGPGIVGPYASPAAFPNGAINVAVVPGTNIPITISSIYVDPTQTPPSLNSQYYISNTTEQSHEFNGFTTPIDIQFQVQCGQTYHFKIAIADAQDDWLDTGVFIEAGSFSSNEVVQIDVATVTGDSTIFEGCAGAVLNFTRPDTAGGLTIHYTIGGNAINGIDYNFIADSIIFQAGFDTTSLTITPFTDALNEGTDTIIITAFTINACGDTNISVGIIFIVDVPDMQTFAPDINLPCPSSLLPISASATGAVPPFSYVWTNSQGNTIGNTSTINVQGLQTDTFFVSITDSCNLITKQDTVIITLNIPPLTLTVNNDTTICPGDQVILTAVGGGGVPGYTYTWEPFSGSPIVNSSITVSPIVSDTFIVSMIDVCNTITMFDTVIINADYTPMTVIVPLVESICTGLPLEVSAVINNGRMPYSVNWTDGINAYSGSPFTFPTDVPTQATLNLVVSDFCNQIEIGMVDIEVIACAIIVPNVITPNGDGMNDVLIFENLEHFPNNHLVLFNRWGQNLFETDGYQNNWDGDGHNQGTYFFTLELNNSDNTIHKGTFTLFK